MAGELTKDVNLEELDLKQRLKLLQDVLISEGFMVKLEEEDDNYYLIEASCPYHQQF